MPDLNPDEWRHASWCECDDDIPAPELCECGLSALQSGDPHPEDFCQECGRPNIVWWVDSDEWNKATDRADILCPCCFVERWTEATGLTKILWELRIDPRSTDAASAAPVPEGVPEDRIVPEGWRVEWHDSGPAAALVGPYPVLVPSAEGEQP